jgi:transcriptional regulator with XRE-family HTH domain
MSETTEVNRAAFGQFLNQLRREKGWTQKDLAERLYVSDKAVSKWERGLSLPDVALLLPLAGALGVSVTELLEGRRAVQEQRYSAAEVEALIRRALAFPVEPPERQQARVKRYLPVYLICCVLGVGFGVIYGAYAFFWMAETLPRYYDENRIAQFAQGAMHIHIPGVYYNNRNWRYVLRAFRAWSMASMLLLPPSLAVAGQLDPHLGGKATVAAFAVYILSLFGCIVVPAKRHEKDEE